MAYQYGVSFNCYINGDEFGGGREMSDVAYVSNDYWKLIDHVIKENGSEFSYQARHELVNQETNVGGSVLGVFVEYLGPDLTDEYAVAILFANPSVPEIIE